MGEPAPEVLDKHDKPIPLNDIDREILETKEEDWHLVTWADLKHIIGIQYLPPSASKMMAVDGFKRNQHPRRTQTASR